ncbi:hypothetical protein N4G70_34595 [Streptomyces sp. ASQP_92]|uniref:hypothetical protein n=1 Tax=Streptomyces sp. ASQP_92 TaxID=2979116 RepID=UPI0021BF9699|nr:hypothetical protein [Streptomyces sp. ASQP_92]MCT9093950.1 hypothetical protein [Streptomyces sp. ASQP_92]
MRTNAMRTVGIAGVLGALAVGAMASSVAAASGEEPCRIDTDAAVIRQAPSTSAARMGIGYRDQKCRFHGYTRDVVWAHITMKGSGVDGWVDRHLISTAKEELARTS